MKHKLTRRQREVLELMVENRNHRLVQRDNKWQLSYGEKGQICYVYPKTGTLLLQYDFLFEVSRDTSGTVIYKISDKGLEALDEKS